VSPAPDLLAPVVGYRAWRILGDRLLSPYIPCRWDGPLMHAACFPANRRLVFGDGWVDGHHASPHPECQCGIYAYHRPGAQAYFGEFEWTEGIVTVWGRIEAHAKGLRAEHARVEALALPDQRTSARREAIEAIAARLGVPAVPRASLETVATEFGAPLPPSLLPT
jgi:hypothetical protein